jgi:hypothetical protein
MQGHNGQAHPAHGDAVAHAHRGKIKLTAGDAYPGIRPLTRHFLYFTQGLNNTSKHIRRLLPTRNCKDRYYLKALSVTLFPECF